MFIIIPLILIFLSFAYIQTNEDISIYTEIAIYIFILFIIFISFYLAKIIKNDLHTQKLNIIKLEINKLQKKLNNTTDEKQIMGLTNEIEILKKDLIKNSD